MAPKDNRNEACYSVYRGRVDTPTIYRSWSQVHPRVTGYANAVHKKFDTIELARKDMQSRNVGHFKEEMGMEANGKKPGPRKRKYYAVAGGRHTGVFTDWDDADAASKNTSACHESFATREEADRFIMAWKDAYADTWRRQIRIALDSGWNPKDMKMDTGFLLGKDCDVLPRLENLSIGDGF
ncbi:hypothetical protein BDW42DRAFT_171770 [Aspergillus taichungensis]|uniref:Ribonuclease H1 N-terminal domain-containing protein n=1 Tax=Aspergillus taichungensis TaxID=482145 RepID=A0A2J5HS04_9EURO|nr:hypothetical protein BDW42DRAFT_171770 [Aspergillus taichungensis]